MGGRSRTFLRLGFKAQRFEAVTVVLAGWLATLLAVILALFLGDALRGGAFARLSERLQLWADIWLTVMPVLPYAVGLLLGAPLFSRELEQHTVVLDWTLAPSRRRWLLERLLVATVLLLLALIPVAVAGDALVGARTGQDAGTSFEAYGARGMVMVARGFGALAVGGLVGLIVGRQLPALILAALGTVALAWGAGQAMNPWYDAHALSVPLDGAQAGDRANGYTYLRAPDGTILTFEQAYAMAPADPSMPPGAVNDAWILAHFTYVTSVVPAAQYLPTTLVEGVGFTGTGVLLAVVALPVVSRRRIA